MKEKNIVITAASLANGMVNNKPIDIDIETEGRQSLIINPAMDYLAENINEEQAKNKIKRGFVQLITNPRRKFADNYFEVGAIMRPANVISERTTKLGSIIDSIIVEIRKEYPEVG